MAGSVLKPRSKHIKVSGKRYLLGQNNLQIFGVIPFIKLQNRITVGMCNVGKEQVLRLSGKVGE